MEVYHLKENINVFGRVVDTFPDGIGEAFADLMNMLGDDFKRSYFGISTMGADGKMIYIAAVEEKVENEGQRFDCEPFVIGSGEYLAVTLRDWRKKTDAIHDVFSDMVIDPRADCSQPGIEWYKDDDEMVCMMTKKVVSQRPV